MIKDKNYNISVIEVLKETTLSKVKIPKIHSYHTVIFEQGSMVFFKYYGIGKGERVVYEHLNFKPHINIITPWNRESTLYPQTRRKAGLNRCSTELWICTNETCIETFLSRQKFEDHLLLGQHSSCNEIKYRTTKDKAMYEYSKQLKVINTSSDVCINVGNTTDKNITGFLADRCNVPGYAIKQKEIST